MKVKLIAYGIAREILNNRVLDFEFDEGNTIASLKSALFQAYPDFSSLKSLSFAIGQNYEHDSYVLKEHDEVVIIPPVAGG